MVDRTKEYEVHVAEYGTKLYVCSVSWFEAEKDARVWFEKQIELHHRLIEAKEINYQLMRRVPCTGEENGWGWELIQEVEFQKK